MNYILVSENQVLTVNGWKPIGTGGALRLFNKDDTIAALPEYIFASSLGPVSKQEVSGRCSN